LHWKAFDEFYVICLKSGRRHSWCKRCHNASAVERHRKYRERFAERVKAYQQQPEVKERRREMQRLRRFLERQARKRGA
jgi:hypothetical protein